MLQFYFHPFSTYARRVWMTLLEKDIKFEPVEVDLVNRAHREPDYLEKNPYGRVPAINDDGFVLYESSAILHYLEAAHPVPSLMPADARGRAYPPSAHPVSLGWGRELAPGVDRV